MSDIIIEDWETMSWDFSNDVEQDQEEEEYYEEEDEYVEDLPPVNLTMSFKKMKFTQNLAEIKNIKDKKNIQTKEEEVNDDTDEYINIVKPHLNWVKQKKYDSDDDSDSDDDVKQHHRQPVDNNFPELSIKTLTMKKIVNDNSWLQQKQKKENVEKEIKLPTEPRFFKYDKESMVKTRMCNSANKCTMGSKCKFAHSMEELNILKCTYNNCNYRCNYIHSNETKDQYFDRQKKLKLPQEINYALSKISIDKKIIVNGTIYNGTETKVKEKKIKYVEEDPNIVYIRNRNKKTEEIRIIKSYISKNEASIKRLHNSPSSSPLIIKKLQQDILGYKTKLTILEDEFSKIKIEKKKKIEENIPEVVVEEPEPIKEVVKEKPVVVTVELFTSNVKKIEQVPVKKIEQVPVKEEQVPVKEEQVPKVDTAWIEIKKTKKPAPPVSVAPPQSNQKSQMCRSYTTKTKCPHGAKCRYAHNPNELVVNNCGYGSNCKLVKFTSNEYVNTGSKCCIYKHPNETKINFFKRNKF